MPEELQTVAVLGGGTMAAGIAVASAWAGREVVLLDEPDPGHALRRIDRSLAAAAKHHGGSAGDAAAARGRLRITTDVGELAGADLVVEATVAPLEARLELLRRVDVVVGARCFIATNTSTDPVTELAVVVSDPGRFAGLHFFDPVHATKVVEVVAAEQTREATLSALGTFVEQLGMQPIPTKDRPGFLVNRVLLPYLNQALRAYDDGIATREDIDVAVQLGLGYPVGPLALLDRIGLDVHLDATRAAHEQLGDEHFAPPPLLVRLVAAGHLGRESGRGLYDHHQEES